jgi:sortase A
MQKSRLKRINNLLVIVIVVVNAYVLLLPLVPNIGYYKNKAATASTAGIPYKTTQTNDGLNDKRKDIPKDNRLIIPSLALDQPIYEGDDPTTVHKGVWARPDTSTPEKGSNTVLVGHRFTYSGPATFYHLDKIASRDRIIIYWKGVEYNYNVRTIRTVSATALEIENPTDKDVLTLYTCTPLWSAKDRLVVVADKATREEP